MPVSPTSGEQFRILSYNKSGEWCEARVVSGDGSGSRVSVGWIPSNYIAPASNKSPCSLPSSSSASSLVLLSYGSAGAGAA